MSDSLSPGDGRYHFFASRSFRATLSSMASARSFLSFAFSSSSAFSRLASDTSRPPNLACPRVERRLADPVPPAHVRGLRARLLLAQDGNDLLLYSVHFRQPRKAGTSRVLCFCSWSAGRHMMVFKRTCGSSSSACSSAVAAATTDHANSNILRPATGASVDGSGSKSCRYCRPTELGAVPPHAVEDDGHLPGKRYFGSFGPQPLRKPHRPCFHWRPSRGWPEHDVGCFEQCCSCLAVADFGDASRPIQFSRLIAPRCQPEVCAYGP
jgi:hypothetical protein